MKSLRVIACILLWANSCYAVAVKSNGTGGGRWSDTATWAGKAVPVNGDSVTIVAGDTVTFDVNMSSWVTGVAGLTCNGIMNGSAAPGTYCLKTSADITGTGRINCGSSDMVYPFTCTMTFDFNSTLSSFECGSGLVLNLYCIQPAHPFVALSAVEAAGQTQLSVDTDVRGDIWVDGAAVRVDAVSGKLPDSETRTIAKGGVAAAAITVNSGLAKDKGLGAKVILVTRNIRIIGSTEYAVKYMTGGVLGCEISDCAGGIYSSFGTTISGTVSGGTYGVSSNSGNVISGTISGCDYGITTVSGDTISGTVSGCFYGVSYSSGCMITGTISGCNHGVYYGSGSVISATISGCVNGVFAGANTIQDAVFNANASDLRRVVSVSAYNSLFSGGVENSEYNTGRVPSWSYVASYDHNRVANAFKAWTCGGMVVSDVNITPPGYMTSYRHVCASSSLPCFRQELTTVGPGQTLRVQGKILILENHAAWAPRLELIDVCADPLVNPDQSALVSMPIPSPVGRYYWQDVVVEYTNTSMVSKRVWIRCLAQQAGTDVYEVWSTELNKVVSP
jgi:hypothetical protein